MRCILKAHVRIRLVVSDHPDPRGGYSMRLGLVAYLVLGIVFMAACASEPTAISTKTPTSTPIPVPTFTPTPYVVPIDTISPTARALP